MNSLSEQARTIFAETMRRIDVRHAVQQSIQYNRETLTLGTSTVGLRDLDEVLIIAIGKAAAPMYLAAEESLRSTGVPLSAVVVAPQSHAQSLPHKIFLPGSHPTPDQYSLYAAEQVLDLLHKATPRTAVLFLISGGASAMLEKPLDPSIPVTNIAKFYDALVGSGLSIVQINVLRKHFSAVKGGRLAEAAATAHIQCTLLISDVPSAAPAAIASGPSSPDSTTLEECHDLFKQLQQSNEIPSSVAAFFASSHCVETPKPDASFFKHASWSVILSSQHLAAAAFSAAHEAGFECEIDNTCDEWEYREAARYLLDRSADLASHHPRSCLISVGEVSVALPTGAGKGGRNQQFALWSAHELIRRNEKATILSAGSDGVDGNSNAAGAVCDENTSKRARLSGFSAEDSLSRFDSATLLHALGEDIVIGPTGNNLRDLRLILRDSAS